MNAPPNFSSAGADQKSKPLAAPTAFAGDSFVGRQLGHFQIEAKLGSGAMASVYRATDQLLGRQVALKLLLPGADEVVRKRFRQEARTVSVLEHPHIVHTLQVGQSDGVTYIAMELVEGTSLSELLGEAGRLSVVDSCRLLEPIARALAYAHRQGVVHRDVKPSNILLRRVAPDAAGAIRLAALPYPVVPLLSDFGIALALDAPELTAAGRTVGTPAYMAPEQASDSREIDGRADLYALGTVLYRCLMGRPPFTGSTTQILHAHVYEPLTIPEQMRRSLPPVVLDMLRRALAKEPDQRYPNSALFAADLALAAVRPTATVPNQGDLTSTLDALPATGSSVNPTERGHVLVPAPKVGTTRPTTVKPVLSPFKKTSLSATQAKISRGRRNWLALVAGSLLALMLTATGIALITLFVLRGAPLVPSPTPVAPLVQPQSVPATVVETTPQPTRVEPSALAASTPATPTATPTPAPVGTVEVDVELYWENASEDYQKRNWNQTLDNLILVLRADNAFAQALARSAESQATLVRTLLLDNPTATLWAEWQSLFEPAQIEEMLFHTYIGLATQENARGEPQKALDHFDDALTLRPAATRILGLRNATANFLASGDATREDDRRVLGVAHQDYAMLLARESDFCGAYEQISAATKLLLNDDLNEWLTQYRQACDTTLTTQAGESLLKELSGSILYSTQVGEAYRIYRLPLQPSPTPVLLVEHGAQPALSADGRWLALRETRSNQPGISGVELNGALNPDQRTIRYTTAAGDGEFSPPGWSPDGGRLVFASDRETDGRKRIYIQPATAGDHPTALAFGEDPVWRPLLGESMILYSGRDNSGNRPGLRLINDLGVTILQLTENEYDRRPAWSPDAKSIVFMSNGRDGNWEVYRLSVETEAIQRLTDDPAQDGLPTVSPDGNYVAYVSDHGGKWNLWVVPLDGSAAPALIAPLEGELTSWLEHAIQWVKN